MYILKHHYKLIKMIMSYSLREEKVLKHKQKCQLQGLNNLEEKVKGLEEEVIQLKEENSKQVDVINNYED